MTQVMLGGREYVLKPLPLRPARALREKIAAQIGGFGQQLQALDGLEVTKLDDIGGLIERLGGTLAGSVDLAAEWLFEFSPEIAADRERIMNEAFDEEVLKAFTEALKMLYPFGGMLNSLSGLAGQASLTNSRSASGGFGRTRSTK